MKGIGMLIGKFEWKPKRRPFWVWLTLFWLLKDTTLEMFQGPVKGFWRQATLPQNVATIFSKEPTVNRN